MAAGRRQVLQTQITADAVLQMHHQIALLQVREINVQRRARGLGMRRFQSARPLDLVTPEDFRVGDHDELRLVADESAGERAEVKLRASQAARRGGQTQFFPDFR